MTQQPTDLTAEGEKKLKAELAELTGPRRQDLAARLRSAMGSSQLQAPPTLAGTTHMKTGQLLSSFLSGFHPARSQVRVTTRVPGRASARIFGRSMRINSGKSHIAMTVASLRSASNAF